MREGGGTGNNFEYVEIREYLFENWFAQAGCVTETALLQRVQRPMSNQV